VCLEELEESGYELVVVGFVLAGGEAAIDRHYYYHKNKSSVPAALLLLRGDRLVYRDRLGPLLAVLLDGRVALLLLLASLDAVGLYGEWGTAYDSALIYFISIIFTIFSAAFLNTSSTLYPLWEEVS
jgi:hypothetical protein